MKGRQTGKSLQTDQFEAPGVEGQKKRAGISSWALPVRNNPVNPGWVTIETRKTPSRDEDAAMPTLMWNTIHHLANYRTIEPPSLS